MNTWRIMKNKKLLTIFVCLLCFLSGMVFMYYFDKFSYYSDLRVTIHKDNGMLNQIDIVPDEKTGRILQVGHTAANPKWWSRIVE